jgi:4-hydroxy-3-methylbut-2-enyl diphosphate reductase
MTDTTILRPLTLILASPRGFCAGVDRAIQIVEKAIKKFGPPVYVRHEIVHNRFVIEALKHKGAIFIEELNEIPDDGKVIFSAHGVSQSVLAKVKARGLTYFDATCPLVSKVHIEVHRFHKRGLEIILIGHAGHPEVIGTMGQLPDGAVKLIETLSDAHTFVTDNPDKLAFVTQTTLSVDDTAEIITVLKKRFTNIITSHKEDICYATTNRQEAIKIVALRAEAILVIGAPNSSNSTQLVEAAKRCASCSYAALIQQASDIDWKALGYPRTVGLTASASAPEVLVTEVINAFSARFHVIIETAEIVRESIQFRLPHTLAC